MLYWLNNSYMPTSAMTNRTLAYIKGLSELGIETEVCFFFPDQNRAKVLVEYPHIKFNYFWESDFSKNTLVKAFRYILHLYSFWRKLRQGDKVYIYNMEDALKFLIRKKGVDFYIERTEHPSIYPMGSVLYSPSIPQYVRDLKKAKGLIVISHALKDFFISQGVPDDKIQIVNIMVDPERFRYVLKSPRDYKYIAYCGTASNNKDGVDQLLKAFAIFSASHTGYKLLIIGNSPSINEESNNLKLIEKLNIKDDVVFTGVVPIEKIPELLVNADILALDRPDNIQAKYGFPTKMGEYLLSKVPVVVTAVGDLPLFLKNQETAILAEPNNPESFAKKLSWVADHPKESAYIGECGNNLAINEFNYLHETKKIIDFIYR